MIFPNSDRMQQVIFQADAKYRMQPEDILRLYVRNASAEWHRSLSLFMRSGETSPLQLVRYQGYQSINKIPAIPHTAIQVAMR